MGGREWPGHPIAEREVSKMARHATTIVDTNAGDLIPLESIPDDVKAFVEEVWAKQRKTKSRERVVYDSDQERETEYKQITSYVAQRPAKLGGVLAVRRSPSKDLPDHGMDLRFKADLPANAAANANRESGQVSR
jgi:hypothetical protein